MDFHKYHALGNDYIVIDPQKTQIEPDVDTVELICHRNFGVGSDGILYGPILHEGRIGLRIYNPDGSEAQKSGNGVRIFARYLHEKGLLESGVFRLETAGGPVEGRLLDDKGDLIAVEMGTVSFRSKDLVREIVKAGDREFQTVCLSIGNPHCVVPLEEISPEECGQCTECYQESDEKIYRVYTRHKKDNNN